MNRRQFLISSAVAGVSLTLTGVAQARFVDYSKSVYQKALSSGEPFMLDFKADWCGTCKAQERVIRRLQESAPYKGIKIILVDWDLYRDDEIRHSLNIPRRSTLIMFNGGREVGRVVAKTSERDIKKLFDKAL